MYKYRGMIVMYYMNITYIIRLMIILGIKKKTRINQ